MKELLVLAAGLTPSSATVLCGNCVRIPPLEGVSIKVQRGKKHNCKGIGRLKKAQFTDLFIREGRMVKHA